ncbi:hypothetical protein C2S52_010953 [Perilla frutescens var. hirtella]|nr:hypothetical protein C2S52_010953 [Perilla frutescens var. hirtella]
MERGPIDRPETSSSQLRLPLRSLRPSVVVYAQPEVVDLIRATLHTIGGDDTIRLFRSGCFGYFLDYRGGDVQKRVIHALMTYEVHMSDRARVGREAWFHIHHSKLRFGPRKRTTVREMEDRFGKMKMARDAPDYVKALAEDVERWNSFSWGAYSYQMLMHFIGLLPRTRQAMGGKGSRQYLFTGRSGHSRYGQLTVSRFACGYVGTISRGDGDFILPEHVVGGWCSEREICSLSKGEQKEDACKCSILLFQFSRGGYPPISPRDEPDLDYIPGLRPPTEEVTEHTADLIHRESPSRAWGRKRSRRDRSYNIGEPSESFLQRVVDDVIPRVQEYVGRVVAQALAGLSSRAWRSPTPDMGHHNPEPSDRSAAHRAPIPPPESAPQTPTPSASSAPQQEGPSTIISRPRPAGYSSTQQIWNAADDAVLMTAYGRFRCLGPAANILMLVNNLSVFQS